MTPLPSDAGITSSPRGVGVTSTGVLMSVVGVPAAGVDELEPDPHATMHDATAQTAPQRQIRFMLPERRMRQRPLQCE